MEEVITNINQVNDCKKQKDTIGNLTYCKSMCRKCFISEGSFGRVMKANFNRNGTNENVAAKVVNSDN